MEGRNVKIKDPGPCRCTIGTMQRRVGVLEEGIRFCGLHAKAEEMQDALNGLLKCAEELMAQKKNLTPGGCTRSEWHSIINDANALLAELEDR